MRFSDYWREVWISLNNRPARTLMTMLSIVLAVASSVGVIGMAQTAKGQIGEKFNELEATTVHITDHSPKQQKKESLAFPVDASSRITRLNGAKEAVTYWRIDPNSHHLSIEQRAAYPSETLQDSTIPVYAANEGLYEFAKHHSFNASHVRNTTKVAMIGKSVAKRFHLQESSVPARLFLNNEAFTVIGVLPEIDRLPELSSSVVIPTTTALHLFGKPTINMPAHMLIRTELGAATLISRQAPVALSPEAPSTFVVDALPDWSRGTSGVASSVSILQLGLSAIALIIGCVGIANSMTASIYERIPEIGLRRALGAKTTSIATQIIGETALQGVIGGLLGTTIGILVIISVSAAQQWTPIIDPRILILAPLAGIASGIIAGVQPAIAAIHISPIAALQHG